MCRLNRVAMNRRTAVRAGILGQSFACNPSGEIIAQGSVDQNETLLVEIDRARVNEARTHWPFLRDRRIDAYDAITRRFWIHELPRPTSPHTHRLLH